MAHKGSYGGKLSRGGQKRVSAKISKMMHAGEKMPHKQMVAMAMQMERSHRLTTGGGYKRVGRKKR